MFIRARIVPVIGFLAFVLIAMFGARFASETAQASTELRGKVYWSDGSSGRLSDGTRFRLNGIEAPATGSMNQRGGAKCEAERVLGFEAKAAASELTRGRTVTVSRVLGRDRDGRNIVDLSLDGMNVGALLVASGTHHTWDHEGRNAKHDWCEAAHT